MKIARVEHLHADAGQRNFDFLKLTTDDGLVGWSEYNESFGGLGVSVTTLPGAARVAIAATVASTSGRVRYGTTPSQIHVVGSVRSCEPSSASSRLLRLRSAATRASRAIDASPSLRSRASACDAGWSTRTTVAPTSASSRQGRESRPAPTITT